MAFLKALWLIAVCLLATPFAHSSNQQNAHIDLPIQPLNKSLEALSSRYQCSLIYPFDKTQFIMAPSIQGDYSFDKAIGTLLENTPFSYKKSQLGSYVVVAKNRIKTKVALSTKTIEQSPLITVKAPEAQATTAIEELIIVGSRTGEKPLDALALAAETVNENALDHSGSLDIGTALQKSSPTFSIPISTLTDGSDAQRPATLRGLAPDQLVVLINGKRRHHSALLHTSQSVGRGSSGVDLNSIPRSAIKRIEILKEGASAQYGSDAIAGVINIVLHDDNTEGDLSLSLGSYEKGDGESANISAYKGFNPTDSSHINVAVEHANQNATNRSNETGQCQYIDSCTAIGESTFVTDNPREIAFERHNHKIGFADKMRSSVSLNASHYTADNWKYYLHLDGASQESSIFGFYRRANQPQRNPIYTIDGLPVNNGEAYHPDGFLPKLYISSDDVGFSLGSTVKANDWLWDISYSGGKNNFRYDVARTINASLVSQTGFSPSEAHAGTLSTSLQTLTVDGSYYFNGCVFVLGAQWREDGYQIQPGAPLSYRDYDSDDGRAETLATAPNQPGALGGTQIFPGFSPSNATNHLRDTIAAYTEVQMVRGNTQINIAARWEEVAEVASHLSKKLSISQQVHPSLTFKLGFNTGFRAPSMHQLYYSDLSNQFFIEDGTLRPKRVATLRNDSAPAQLLGIDRLKQELSKSSSAGLNWDIGKFKLSVDSFIIDIKDRVLTSSIVMPDTIEGLEEELDRHNANVAQFFFNGADTLTRGYDFRLKTHHRLWGGQAKWQAAYSYTETDVTEKHPLGDIPVQGNAYTTPLSAQAQSILESWQPKRKSTLALTWKKQRVTVTADAQYYGKYQITEDNGDTQQFSAETVLNAGINYQLKNNLNVDIGINNLLNNTPDKTRIGQEGTGTILDASGNTVVSSPGIFQYSRRYAPFDYNGSYYYSGIRYRF